MQSIKISKGVEVSIPNLIVLLHRANLDSLSAKPWRAFSTSKVALSEGRLNSLDTFTDEELMLQESGEPPSCISDEEV